MGLTVPGRGHAICELPIKSRPGALLRLALPAIVETESTRPGPFLPTPAVWGAWLSSDEANPRPSAGLGPEYPRFVDTNPPPSSI